jgi:hypothetical protein
MSVSNKLLIVALILFLVIYFLGGCASTNSNTNKKANASSLNIQSNKKFDKIKIGMGMTQIHNLIGTFTDSDVKTSGKAINPFYFGSDRIRTIFFYKGEGRLIFNAKNKLIKIEYDPSEDGYK